MNLQSQRGYETGRVAPQSATQVQPPMRAPRKQEPTRERPFRFSLLAAEAAEVFFTPEPPEAPPPAAGAAAPAAANTSASEASEPDSSLPCNAEAADICSTRSSWDRERVRGAYGACVGARRFTGIAPVATHGLKALLPEGTHI